MLCIRLCFSRAHLTLDVCSLKSFFFDSQTLVTRVTRVGTWTARVSGRRASESRCRTASPSAEAVVVAVDGEGTILEIAEGGRLPGDRLGTDPGMFKSRN